ncbi:MAG: hydrogen peroxide-dependent heme synthase [Candidatus Sulfotelmatobacter sp.]
MADLLPVPLTLEGSCVLHQMFRFDWRAWRRLSSAERERMTEHATDLMGALERGTRDEPTNRSAMYSQLGHKGDLLMIHFRDSIVDLNRVELALAQIDLHDFLEAQSSYLSVVELGLYESSTKTYATLAAEGHEPHTPEWDSAIENLANRQAAAMAGRLRPGIPNATYVCFYPMDRRRGEQLNWYTTSMTERQRMMHEHSIIGRRYAGQVRQIITGSIGWDDWEWGVDLFADNPLVFKKLIYEMRFDEASALYADFGSFHLGVRLPPTELGKWLTGTLGNQE